MASSEAPTLSGDVKIFDSIRAVFGRYKAEWLREDLFPLFRQPEYFPELEQARPTVLVGGRGTGKTTALKGLSYEGSYQLEGKSKLAALEIPYIGLYWCIDANRVTAFDGPELEQGNWQKLFAHYVNLEVVSHQCQYALWFGEIVGEPVVAREDSLNKVTTSLHLGPATDLHELSKQLGLAIVRLEALLNSILDDDLGPLSLPGAPIEYMTEALTSDPRIRGKTFYVLVDEFENLTTPQQVVMNTLVKHGRAEYVFKLGVKEGGWRTRATLAGDETLVHPADYDMIDLSQRLSESTYQTFASEVCNARLERAYEQVGVAEAAPNIQKVFESLTPDDEARLLGIKKRVGSVRARLSQGDSEDAATMLTDLELYYLDRRTTSRNREIENEIRSFVSDPKARANYVNNYRQSLLFTVSEHTGRGIQKYYAGWETLVKMSGGNIRYMVELVERAYARHVAAGKPASEPISARHQTEACIEVGKKYVQEVQSLDPLGQQLTYLLLGLGRYFNLLARHSEGRQPDTTSFLVGPSEVVDHNRELQHLLDRAVMHQVLRRNPATKATSDFDSKEWEYSVHPIFAAFFVIPYQKKRRVRLRAGDLLLLTSSVRRGLRMLLRERSREIASLDETLPDQMSLFEPTYG